MYTRDFTNKYLQHGKMHAYYKCTQHVTDLEKVAVINTGFPPSKKKKMLTHHLNLLVLKT